MDNAGRTALDHQDGSGALRHQRAARFDRQDANARAELVRRAIEAGDEDAEKTVPPSRRRLVVDPTIEAVGEILSKQNCGTTLVRDELSWLVQ